MDLLKIAGEAVDYAKEHSPKLLLIFGIGLGGASVVCSGVASFKASNIVNDIHNDPKNKDKKELTKAYATRVVPLYIPVLVCGAGSVICLVKSYDINAKRLAAATAFIEISTQAYKAYREKTQKLIGEEKVKEIEKEIIEEQSAKKKDEENTKDISIVKDSDVVWFHDTLTGQEFVSTITNVIRANNKFLERMNIEMFMSKNEWIDILKEYTFNANDGEYQVHPVPDGDDVGWFKGETLHIYTDKVKKNDRGIPSIYLEYSARPEPRFSNKLSEVYNRRW